MKAKQVTNEMKKDFVSQLNVWIKGEILESINKGISPVDQKNAYPKNTGGKTRYQKYSESYQDQITRRAAYLHFKGGGSIRIDDEDEQDYIDELNEYLIKNNKRIRPVNLKVSGTLHRSLKKKKGLGYLRLTFEDPKAIYHDQKGAGKSKVIRRLLPRGVEEFNRPIQRRIIDTIELVINKLI